MYYTWIKNSKTPLSRFTNPRAGMVKTKRKSCSLCIVSSNLDIGKKNASNLKGLLIPWYPSLRGSTSHFLLNMAVYIHFICPPLLLSWFSDLPVYPYMRYVMMLPLAQWFLSASDHIYKRQCPSVGQLVIRLVDLLVTQTYFLANFASFGCVKVC